MRKVLLHQQITAALLAALLAVISPLYIPLYGIPLTLSTFGVYMCALLAGGGWGTAAVIVYLLLGVVGIPVFSGLVGGFQVFAGPTGGFLLGYLPCVLLAGWLCRRLGEKPLLWGVSLLCGTALLYTCGTVWYMLYTNLSLQAALLTCVVPFLPWDVIKMIAAISLAYPVKKVLQKT